jgi:hypothetical protein
LDQAQEARIDRLEDDVKELKETNKKFAEDITELKEGQAESRIYQKLIMEQLGEIKIMITSRKDKTEKGSPNKEWIDLIKWIIGITFGAIVAWFVKGAV